MGCKHQANTMQFGVDFFVILHSAVIWISELKYFSNQYFVFNTKCAAIEQKISCIFIFIWSILATLYLWQMAFWTKWSKSVPNGAKEDACRTGSVWKSHEKINCHSEHFDHGEVTARSRLCILVTVNSRWTHLKDTVGSMWASDFFSWVIMTMISFFYKLKCMFLNLIHFDLWSCHSIHGMFSIFHIFFHKILLMDMILCSNACATYTVT